MAAEPHGHNPMPGIAIRRIGGPSCHSTAEQNFEYRWIKNGAIVTGLLLRQLLFCVTLLLVAIEPQQLSRGGHKGPSRLPSVPSAPPRLPPMQQCATNPIQATPLAARCRPCTKLARRLRRRHSCQRRAVQRGDFCAVCALREVILKPNQQTLRHPISTPPLTVQYGGRHRLNYYRMTS
jgi:hypothetical protein